MLNKKENQTKPLLEEGPPRSCSLTGHCPWSLPSPQWCLGLESTSVRFTTLFLDGVTCSRGSSALQGPEDGCTAPARTAQGTCGCLALHRYNSNLTLRVIGQLSSQATPFRGANPGCLLNAHSAALPQPVTWLLPRTAHRLITFMFFPALFSSQHRRFATRV